LHDGVKGLSSMGGFDAARNGGKGDTSRRRRRLLVLFPSWLADVAKPLRASA
jgi:hypothetical protein